jgi:Flp pilus assembly protein TadG
MTMRRLRDETGAEAIEFALVAPIMLFLVIGLVYGLLAVAAHLSLGHATSRGLRYATIPTDPVSAVYPTGDEVAERVASQTPFFTADDCTTTVTGDERENAPVTLEVSCDFPNPLGGAVEGLRNAFFGGGSDQPDVIAMTTRAEGRRE